MKCNFSNGPAITCTREANSWNLSVHQLSYYFESEGRATMTGFCSISYVWCICMGLIQVLIAQRNLIYFASRSDSRFTWDRIRDFQGNSNRLSTFAHFKSCDKNGKKMLKLTMDPSGMGTYELCPSVGKAYQVLSKASASCVSHWDKTKPPDQTGKRTYNAARDTTHTHARARARTHTQMETQPKV